MPQMRQAGMAMKRKQVNRFGMVVLWLFEGLDELQVTGLV